MIIPFPNWPNSSMFLWKWNQGCYNSWSFLHKSGYKNLISVLFSTIIYSSLDHYLKTTNQERPTSMRSIPEKRQLGTIGVLNSVPWHRTYRYLRFERVMLSASNSLLWDPSAQSFEYLDGNLYKEDVFDCSTLVNFERLRTMSAKEFSM